MPCVVVAGSFNVDHVWRVAQLPAPGATLSGRYTSGPGGKGFNQAIAAARTGTDTRFICALGEDAGAQLARELCAHDGIALHAATATLPTGTAGIYVDAEGRNCIVIGAGANAALTPDFVASALTDVRADDVVLTQLESPLTAVAQALAAGHAAGAITILNPAPANVVIAAALLHHADILTPNETEFVALLARHLDEHLHADAVADIDADRLHVLCRKLLPGGTVVITLGARGCFVSHSEHTLHSDAHPYYKQPAKRAQVVDTTGAGDAFNGALAASLVQHPQRAFIEHIRFAGHYAARSTEHAGAALAMPYLPVE